MYEYSGEIIRVIDGHTVEAEVDLGFGLTFRMILRLYGINAPERRGTSHADGERAKGYLIWLIDHLGKQHERCIIRTEKDASGKDGLYRATLMYGWESINEQMVAGGHAQRVTY